jgi:SAM-dependent methyltransferase
MGIGLGEEIENSYMDSFLASEGYPRKVRRYCRVVRCWCGSEALRELSAHGDYQLCTECGCLLLRYVLAPSYLEELYGEIYFNGHQAAIGLPSLRQRYETDVHDRIPVWMAAILRHFSGGRLIEVGSSHGRFLKELADAGFQVTGLELDRSTASRAREKTGLDIRRSSIEEIPPACYDVLVANDVLEHLYDPRKMLSDSMRVLEEGGKAFFQTVVFDRWTSCPPAALRPLYHVVLYSRESLERLIPASGRLLSVEETVFGCSYMVVLKTPSDRND